MTRKEITGIRPLDFSSWVRINLPDSSTGFCASDLDFIFWNWKNKKVMLLELKTRNSKPRPFQKLMWQHLNKWIKNGIDQEWEYYGFHLIVFEKTNFDDGLCYLNGNKITEKDLINFLSFE